MPIHKAATALMSILLATTVHADDAFGPVDFCRDLSLIANQVMSARQKNKPMSEVIPVVADRLLSWGDKYGIEMDMDKAERTAAEMVITAYQEMIIPVERLQRIEITEFENAIFQECYEEWTSD